MEDDKKIDAVKWEPFIDKNRSCKNQSVQVD